ncbi:MAG: hypothetical protein ACR2QV_16920 [Gammaproteobacteria bacterium]
MTRRQNTHPLRVADWTKARGTDSLPAPVLDAFERSGLLLDTCLRQLCITVHPLAPPAGAEIRCGAEAYRHALEVITGLRSAIPGETNVFGQFRQAWQNCRDNGHPGIVAGIAPWVHRLINDARTIRRDHLHGIGGASYGTLVRRLVAPRRGDRVLFVGAGGLARSIVPYFGACDVGVWTRRCVDLQNITVDRRFAPARAADASNWADHVVFATPADTDNDGLWLAHLARQSVRTVVHLGHRRGILTAWSGCARVFDLDDVFELRRRQADIRTDRIALARRACRDAACAAIDERAPAEIADFVTA